MKGLKRTVCKYGKSLGHRKGVEGQGLLGYIEARKLIYLPVYLWVLNNRLQKEVELLRAEAAQQELVFLDYETNGVVDNPDKPFFACLFNVNSGLKDI